MRLSWKVVDNASGAPTNVGTRQVAEAGGAATEEELRRLYGELCESLASSILDALVLCASRGRPPYHPAVLVEVDCDPFREPS